ncbi:hypothetical protein JCGZ_06462 [Jatropha curcas]|uniref:Uncharacterized protein n=1 Tax=Jatropha curcas TaxID=180498 RepID=A0A067KS36_JATCU|nr:hypothetical protein JCGZ_06462 [Jatropha curcas]
MHMIKDRNAHSESIMLNVQNGLRSGRTVCTVAVAKSKFEYSPEPLDKLIKARRLRSVNLKQVIVEGYPVYSLSKLRRSNPYPPEMDPKKVRSSKMSKIAKAMRK